jgi:RNA polymerase sigma factor (TIGR02999 family)
MGNQADLTDLIQRAGHGDASAADELFSVTYADLRRLARARLRTGGRNTLLDTVALVNESYLRFASAGQLRLEDRVHFMRWAACAMRCGGEALRVSLEDDLAASVAPEDEILSVHEALEKIAAFDPRLVQVVELRYFGGLTEAETAEALGVTDRTIRRDWEKARLLLREALT